MRLLRIVVYVAFVFAGCLQSSSVQCEDGSLCPTGTACTTVAGRRFCVTSDQLAKCSGAADGAPCVADLVPNGACHGGACLAISCGNGIVDGITNEECDDGNLVSHDGCTSQCKKESAHWELLDVNHVGDRTSFGMAYDIARDQVVLFGGSIAAGPTYTADTWLWSGTGWQKANPIASPPARTGAAMTYDIARKRVVLFGGETAAGVASDTWEWDGSTWKLRASSSNPSVRQHHAMAYDAGRKRVVLFGGSVLLATKPYDDTWEWDGTKWNQATGSTVPEYRRDAAMAYDPVRGRIVMYGGTDPTVGSLSTTWEYDGTSWRRITGSTPGTITTYAAMAFDPSSNAIVLYGGEDSGGTPHDATYAWNGVTWTPLGVVSGYAATRHAMVTDGHRRRTIAFSGASNRTLVWSGNTWSDVTPVPLSTVVANQVATDPLRGRAVMFDPTSQTFEYDGTGWVRRAVASPTARDGATLAYDATHGECVMFGGLSGGTTLKGDTWRYDGNAWTQSAALGPSPRQYASTAWDAKHQRLVLFGGQTAIGPSQVSDETWSWDGTAWLPATPTSKPSQRHHDSLAYDPDHGEIVLFGGYDDSVAMTYDGDTWTWDGDWHMKSPMHYPGPRYGASLSWDPTRRRVIMFGGIGLQGELQDAWEWDGTDWLLVDSNVLPPNRSGAAMFPDPAGAGVVIVGGIRAGAPLDETWRLRWDGPTADETCHDAAADDDGDHLAACADADCWARCTPACPPGQSCLASAPRCGDGVCSALESCRLCPMDCGACMATCGDGYCDAGETKPSCPGDCGV